MQTVLVYWNFDDSPAAAPQMVNMISDAPGVIDYDARALRRQPLRVPGYEN